MLSRSLRLCLMALTITAFFGSSVQAAEHLRTYDDCFDASRKLDKDRKKGKDPSRRQYQAVFDSDHFAIDEYDRFDARAPLKAEIWFLGAFPPCSPRPNRKLSSFTIAPGEALAVQVDELDFTKLQKLHKTRKLKLHLTFRAVDIKTHPMPAYDAKACPGNQPKFSQSDVAPQIFIRAEKGFIQAPGGKRYTLLRVVDGETQDITASAAKIKAVPVPKPKPEPKPKPKPKRVAEVSPDTGQPDEAGQKKKQLEQAWKAVSKQARDKRIAVKTRGEALKGFIEAYPDAGPLRTTAEKLMRQVWPGSLVIQTEPVGAFVTIKGLRGGKAPLIRKVKAGLFKIKAVRKGYQPITKQAQVEPGQTTELRLELITLPGTLTVTSEPAGAEILIGEKMIGLSPITAQVPSGDLLVRARLAGYQAAEGQVKLVARGKASLTLTLARGFGSIKIDSKPAGSMVTIDGEEKGLAPVSLDILAGPHVVVVMMSGFDPAERVVEVQADQLSEELFELGKAAPGTLVINTELSGAKLTLNGKPAGQSPFSDKVEAGTYVVAVALDGYSGQEQATIVLSGQRAEVSFKLSQVPPGKVEIVSKPPGATVWLDGKKVGTTPFAGQAAVGRRLVRVVLSGHGQKEQKVQVESGKIAKLDLALKREPRGKLRVGSKPIGAAVSIDGSIAGGTPFEKALPPGPHVVKLSKKGYDTIQRTVQVSEGETTSLDLKLRQKGLSTLSVRSMPAGARISVDGLAVGKTPVDKHLDPGPHAITISLAGYETAERKLTLEPGRSLDVTIPLELLNEMGPLTTFGHVGFWTGLGLAGFGSAAAVMASQAADDFRQQSWDTDADDRSQMWSGLMWGGLISGGVLMIAGAVLWILPEDDSSGPSVGAVLAPDPAGGMNVGIGGGW
jgi:hypothetical protein